MTTTYSINYLTCQTCHAKVHCASCEQDLLESIRRCGDIRDPKLDLLAGQLTVDASTDPDLLEETLEDLGIFLR